MSRRAGRRGWGAVGLSYRRAVNFNKTQAAGKESEQNGWSFILVSVRVFLCVFLFFLWKELEAAQTNKAMP